MVVEIVVVAAVVVATLATHLSVEADASLGGGSQPPRMVLVDVVWEHGERGVVSVPYCTPFEVDVVRYADPQHARPHARFRLSVPLVGGGERAATELGEGAQLRVWMRGAEGGVESLETYSWEPWAGESAAEATRLAVAWTSCREDPDEAFFLQVLLAAGAVGAALAVLTVLAMQTLESGGMKQA